MVYAPGLDFRLRIAVTFATPCVVSDARRVLHVTDGTFDGPSLGGPSLSGIVLPGGGDWLLSRRDGAIELDIRFALRTAEGESIYLRGTGLFVASDAVTARIRGGEDVPPDAYYFRTAILFETGAVRLAHLNHALHVGVGRRTPNGMVTDIFAVSQSHSVIPSDARDPGPT